MFKKYSIPFSLEQKDWQIQFSQTDKFIHYSRCCKDDKLEKQLLSNLNSVWLQPVEPLNFPKEMTEHLLIEFSQAISIAPNFTDMIYLTFPIEIGVFLPQGKEWQKLDVFSLPQSKFTLYGDPANGMICKYWSSSIHETIPAVDYMNEGVLKLEIINQSDDWQEVRKTILKADGMKIFYDEKIVCMQARMKIISNVNAETTFINEPLFKNMEQSIEVFSQKKLSLASSKTIMLEGI
jgi:hypothetical protein